MLSVLSSIFLLVGCGGGVGGSSRAEKSDGGSGSSGGWHSLLSPDCSGTYCGVNGNAYTGNGIGVWYYKNNKNSDVSLDVSLSNVKNRDITIIFTNEGKGSAVLPNIPINTTLKNEIEMRAQSVGEYIDTFNHIPQGIRDFNANPILQRSELNRAIIQPLSAKTWQVGEERDWNIYKSATQHEIRTEKLMRQTTLTNGRVVNIWIENGEYGNGKITEAMLNDISQKLNDVIGSASGLIGEPWGEHHHSNLISNNQPLDIVFVNFDKNNSPFGLMGYFYALNNFLKAKYLTSNEALAIFIDSETLYLHNDGELYTMSTIAHELTHAIHFYQRDVLMDDGFGIFLNEMSAVMMEDIAAKKIGTSFNDVRFRYTAWLKESLYRYDFSDWDAYGGDNSYDIAGSFGGFLLRQYGTDFYKTLFQIDSNLSIIGVNEDETARERSLDILDRAIKQYDNEGGLTRALRHWGASIAMLPYDASPKGFGYPYKNSGNFEFEGFDGDSYRQYRILPKSSSMTIYPHGHFPFLRKTTSNTFTETFKVPPQMSVSVVVQ
jgi:hypothetical protein